MQAGAQSSGSQQAFNSNNFDKKTFTGLEKPKDVRRGNIIAAKGKIYEVIRSYFK